MSNFDETIKRYYSSMSLPAEKVETILANSVRARKSLFSRYYKFAGVAALLIIGFIGLHLQLHKATMTERLLAEIAMNHQKRLNVEVSTDQYEVVQEKLNRLDFSILPVKSELIVNYTLLGGRYCSIHGGLAVQLKVREKASGDFMTLYVTKLTDKLEDITPLDAEFDGVRIRLWKEDHRLLAIAGDKEASQ
jgi:hypothetical protein